MSKIKTTIMIPTYNQEKSIEDAISSAISQDYDNLEIVISDDCSTDGTSLIAKKYSNGKNIRYYRNDRNLGRVANYKETLYKRASGEYVVNLDGDDIFIDNRFISNAIEKIESDKPILYVACKQLNNNQNIIRHRIKENYKLITGLEFVLGLSNNKFIFSHLTTLYSREDAINNEFYGLNILSTDMDSLLRLALKGKVALSNDVVGQWNETGFNTSKMNSFEDLISNLQWVDQVGKDLADYLSAFNLFIWKRKTKKIFFGKSLYDAFMDKKFQWKNIAILIESGVIDIFIQRAIWVQMRKAKLYINNLQHEK